MIIKSFFILFFVGLSLESESQALHWLSQPEAEVVNTQNGNHWNVKNSSNDRYLSFFSYASNLVLGDNNQKFDLFIYDRLEETVQRISTPANSEGSVAARLSESSAVTADGRLIAFLATGDWGFGLPENPLGKVLYLKNLQSDELFPLSINDEGDLFSVTQMHLSNDGETLFLTTKEQLDPIHSNPFSRQLYQLDLTDDSYTLLSVARNGSEEANADISTFKASPDARFVAFSSGATNLGDFSDTSQNVFLLDNTKRLLSLVTLKPDGNPSEYNQGGQLATIKAVSNNGYVVYEAANDDLVIGDNNEERDLFLFNGSTNIRINVDINGIEINEPSLGSVVAITNDGARVAFAENEPLVSEDNNNHSDVYVYGTDERTLELVTQPLANDTFYENNDAQTFSSDGKNLLLISSINHSQSPEASFHTMLFEFELESLESEHINPTAFAPQSADGDTIFPKLSRDQMSVIYISTATNLTTEIQTQEAPRLFLLDRQTNTHQIIATWAVHSNISPSGRFIVFISNLSQPELSTDYGTQQVFLYDRDQQNYTVLAEGNNPSVNDAGQVAFSSSLSLSENDENDHSDIYLYNPMDESFQLISINTDGEAGSSSSSFPVISGSPNNPMVVFNSFASDLVANDRNSQGDVFLYRLNDGTTIRISENNEGVGGNDFSRSASISYSGEFITFRSQATNLTPDTYSNTDLYQGFIFDQNDASLELYSLNQQGNSAILGVDSSDISDSGKYVVYVTREQVLSSDEDDVADVYLYDRDTKTTQLISTQADGQPSNDRFSSAMVAESLTISPALIGVVFTGQGDLTGIDAHPGKQEAFLYQQGGPDVNLNIAIIGAGSVSGSQGISCMTDCDFSYALGTNLTLIANPDTGYVFNRWQSSQGQCVDATNPCLLTMDRDKQINAIFIPENDVIFSTGFE